MGPWPRVSMRKQRRDTTVSPQGWKLLLCALRQTNHCAPLRYRKPNQCPYTAYGTSSFSGGKIDGPILNVTFGDGTNPSGPRGYEKVGLAGIHVPRQQIAICDHVIDDQWPSKPIGGSIGLLRTTRRCFFAMYIFIFLTLHRVLISKYRYPRDRGQLFRCQYSHVLIRVVNSPG